MHFPYFNASDPFLNGIYNSAIQAKEFTIFTNASSSVYVTSNIRGFFFFVSWMSTLGFNVYTFTRFAGPVLLFLLNIFLSFAAYRFLKQPSAYLFPLIFAANSYLLYRFLMGLPEEFSLFLLGGLLFVLSNRAYLKSKHCVIILAILISGIITTHVLIGVFALIFVLTSYACYQFVGGKHEASTILLAALAGVTISVSYPRVIMETILWELQNIARNFVDFQQFISVMDANAVIFDLAFIFVGAGVLLVFTRKGTPFFAMSFKKVYYSLIILLSVIFFASEIFLVFRFPASSIMGPSSFTLIPCLLSIGGLLILVIKRKLFPPSLFVTLCSLFVALSLLMVGATSAVASPRLASYPEQAPETVRLIPETQIILSMLATLCLCSMLSFLLSFSSKYSKITARLRPRNIRISLCLQNSKRWIIVIMCTNAVILAVSSFVSLHQKMVGADGV